ncbi:MAG: hypothetical protein IT537_03115 [Hyphomicrobiales bacterium]|nr:hypothetical protein [Hyphomicrobiales bacterium]
MSDYIPPWLAIARSEIGTKEVPGAADNPTLLAYARKVGEIFPEMASYGALYRADSTAWCGVFAAYCCAMAGVRPPFGPADLDRWMWAQAWKKTKGERLQQPHLGAILVFARHVTFYDGDAGDGYWWCVGGNQSDAVTRTKYAASSCEAIIWPSVITTATKSRRQSNIIATVFADDEVAYTDVRPGWNDRPGVALPFRFPSPRPRVRVYANGRSVDCDIIDQGPWNYTSKARDLPGDPYWETGARPQAESGTDMTGRKTNRAGIDLTPAAANTIGIDGKGLVDWEFITETTMPEPEILAPPNPVESTVPMAANPLLLIGAALLYRRFTETPNMPKGIDLNRLISLMQDPLLQKILSGQPITLPELLSILPKVQALLAGQETSMAAPAPPAIDVPAPTPVTPAAQKPSVQLSALGLAGVVLAQVLGGLGTPFGMGAAPTTAGTLATVTPILTAMIGSTGAFGSVLNIARTLFGVAAPR